jgi:Helix-turn-helix domain
MMDKPIRKFPRVCARAEDSRLILAVGREGETLVRLVEKGSKGLRAYDFAGGPPFRLSAYIHDLRGMGLSIRTEREEHATGWHAVYVLETAVTIVSVDSGKQKGEAA